MFLQYVQNVAVSECKLPGFRIQTWLALRKYASYMGL
jgi:hypothetical protein